jgi:hypothetical protein
MALIYFDGFDFYGSPADRGWTGGGSISTSQKRTGRGSLQGSTNFPRRSLGANYSTLVAGFAFLCNSTTQGTAQIFAFLDGTSNQIAVQWQGNNFPLQVLRGSTVIATGVTNLQANVWYYCEIKVVFSGTSGSVVVRLNGVQELTFSGNTIATANAYANSIAGPGSVYLFIDDLYVLDTTGAVNNDFLGDVAVYTLMPTFDGSQAQWTPVGAPSAYQATREQPADDDATYIATGTAGNVHLFTLDDVPPGATVFGLQAFVRARKDDAGTRVIRIVEKQGATTRETADMGLTGSYVYYQTPIRETAPDGSGWTDAKVNDLEVGVKLTQ